MREAKSMLILSPAVKSISIESVLSPHETSIPSGEVFSGIVKEITPAFGAVPSKVCFELSGTVKA